MKLNYTLIKKHSHNITSQPSQHQIIHNAIKVYKVKINTFTWMWASIKLRSAGIGYPTDSNKEIISHQPQRYFQCPRTNAVFAVFPVFEKYVNCSGVFANISLNRIFYGLCGVFVAQLRAEVSFWSLINFSIFFYQELQFFNLHISVFCANFWQILFYQNFPHFFI